MVRKLVALAAVGLLCLAGLAQAKNDDDNGKHKGKQHREVFTADLDGDQEVPPHETDTTGSFRLIYNGETAEYTLAVRSGTRLTQSHIHCAPAGQNGPVVLFLAGNHSNGWDVDGRWVSNATLTDANVTNPACGATLAEIIEQMRQGNTYVNVHSVANPPGEVRGQVMGPRRGKGPNPR